MKKMGFTLAEVLVTLGIIGVVSAMTVPSLMNNYQRQVYVTQLHKVYNETMQAAQQYRTDKNALNLKEAGLINQTAVDAWVKGYMKIVKDCGTTGANCFAVSEYQRMNGDPVVVLSTSYNSYVLASGTAIAIYARGDGTLQVHVDINAKKGPNIIGRDVFAMMLYPDGTIDDWNGSAPPLTTAARETAYQTYCNATGTTWWGCFGKVLNDNWQMTY